MRITEPTTMLTDYLLAVCCIAFAAGLYRRAPLRGPIALWSAAFLATSLAALAGGTAHGFALLLGADLHRIVWGVTVAAIAASSVLFVVAGVGSFSRSYVPSGNRPEARKWLRVGVLITLAGLAILRSGFSLHQHFNQNDIFHMAQLAGLYAFYRFALLLEPPK